MHCSASELTAHLGAELVGPDVGIEGASIDSRTIRRGQLYVPIVAQRDGHAFIPAALEAGAPAYLTAREPAGGTAICVPDTAAALLVSVLSPAVGSEERSASPGRWGRRPRKIF